MPYPAATCCFECTRVQRNVPRMGRSNGLSNGSASTCNNADTWKSWIKDWKSALNQFSIMFGERLPIRENYVG